MIMKALRLDRSERGQLRHLLRDLVKAGRVIKVGGQNFRLPGARHDTQMRGTVSLSRSGHGFIAPASGGPDRLVDADSLPGIGDGDLVSYRLVRQGHRELAEITDVLQRGQPRMVGTLSWRGDRLLCIPPRSHFCGELLVDPNSYAAEGMVNGTVAVVLVDLDRGRGGVVSASLERVLGQDGDLKVEEEKLIIAHRLRRDFSAEVLREAEAQSRRSPDSERIDRTALPFVTIDGESARDFDDAVCLTWERGLQVVWVAIADVADFVRPGTALDAEALARGTSVYLPQQAIHMLPSALSEGSCSLKPGVPRAAMVVRFELGIDAIPQQMAIEEATICSQARLTYVDVQRVFDGEPADHEWLLSTEGRKMLLGLRKVARQLRARRMREGSIDLLLSEPQFNLDEAGQRVLAITAKLPSEATQLIEELMLLANRQIAEWFRQHALAAIFRVHDLPDEAKLEALREPLRRLGASDLAMEPQLSIQRILRWAKGREDAPIVHRMLLRALAQASYRVENCGHFALAFEAYVHFTSPIRRYPDLMVHRLLKQALGRGPAASAISAAHLSEIAEQCSAREQAAKVVGWESNAVYTLTYLQAHVGECFPGLIVEAAPIGCFVELEGLLISGLLRAESLEDFFYDEAALYYEQSGSHMRLQIGEQIVVRVTRVGLAERHLDLELC